MHDDLKYLDLYDAAFKESPLDPEAPNDLEDATSHIIVGSKQKPCTFEDLDSNFHNDMAFTHFRVRLTKFFNNTLKQEALPNGRRLAFQQQDMVRSLIYVLFIKRLTAS